MARSDLHTSRPAELAVDVVRSPRRRKTVEARLVDGRIRLLIPARMSRKEEQHWITTMRNRFERRAVTDGIDLEARARHLAAKHDLPAPASIRWVDNQAHRWGSCTPADGTIRLSSRMAGYPGWVVDAVIVHELAHLVELHHGAAFKALVARYPLTERAMGFLIAKGLGDDEQLDDPAGEVPDRPTGEGDPGEGSPRLTLF